MPCVTLLVTGVPRRVQLENLSRNLDLLFDTDEIGTFKLRNLPNHPRTNKRQIAIDFRSGFDAMAAQAKLDSFQYEYNGEMYTLCAKVNKVQEYMLSGSFSPERNVENEDWRWSALSTIPDVCFDDNMYRATHSKLNAHLALLRKQKLIVEAEMELLREKRKLKREYGSMDAHDLERRSWSSGRRSGSRGRRSGSRRHRSGSRGRRSVSRGRYSGSRGRHSGSRGRHSRSRGRRSGSMGRRSGSRGRRLGSRGRRSGSRRRRSQSREGHVLRGSREPRTRSRDRSRLRDAWEDRTRQLRSRSKERRSQSHERHDRDRSISQEIRDLRALLVTKRARRESRERSNSVERVHPNTERPYRDPRSKSRERYHRERTSQSYERDYRDQIVSRERNRDRRSMSKDSDYGCNIHSREKVHRDRRSPSRSRYTERRSKERAVRRSRSRNRCSKSRDRTQVDDVIVLSRSQDYRVQRSRTPDYMHRHQPAIMPNPERSEAPTKWSLDAHGDDGINETEESGTVYNTKNQKENQEKKKLAKLNSKRRKAQLLKLKIESVTQNVKLHVLETFYELILDSKVIISDSDQILLEKTLEELVRERVEPLVRLRKDCDIGVVLRKYKLQYSKEKDVLLIRKMLEDITKTNESSAVTHTIKDVAGQATEIQDCSMQESITGVNNENELREDACSGSKPTSTEGNIPQIKGKKSETNGPTIIIDIDSPDKPVPKRPQFYLVIKPLVKDMKRVIVKNNLTQLIKISDLEYVLRNILRRLLKGQGYLPNKEIRNKFRALHPKEKDEQFVRKVIRDIKDGKYPVLTGLPTTDDCEDDVILIEKKYDVVTVEDSDDDDKDLTISGAQEATPQIPTHYPVDSRLKITETSNLGTTNIGPGKHELAKDNPTKLGPSRPSTATHVPDVSGSTNLGPSWLRPNFSPCNLAQVNSSLSNFGATEVPTNPTASRWELVNSYSVNLDLNEPAHNPTPGSIQPGSTFFIPAQKLPEYQSTPKLGPGNPVSSKLRLINNETNSSAVVRPALGSSKLVTGNLDTSKLLVDNRGTANPSSTVVRPGPGTSRPSANPDTSNIRPPYRSSPKLRLNYVRPSNVTVTELTPTNPSRSRRDLIKPRLAKFIPFKLLPRIVGIKTGSSNLAQVNSGPSNDTQLKLNPFNIAQVNPDPSNHDATELRPTNPRTSRWDLLNPGSANLSAAAFRPKPGSSNAQQVIPGLYDLEQVNLDPLNIARINPESTNSSTNFGPVSPGACKFLPTCLRPTELRPALATSKIQPVTPGSATGAVKTISHDSQTTEKANTANIDKTGIIADNDNGMSHLKSKGTEDNSLKVTAITIVTSLNELTKISDKTTDRSEMELPVEDIKEEIPFENLEETDPTLSLDHLTSLTEIDKTKNVDDNRNKETERPKERNNNSLKVTAITIMTSLNEIAAIADKNTHSSGIEPVEEIKEEIESENSETEQIDSISKPRSHESKEVHGSKSYNKDKGTPKNTEGTNDDQVDSSCGKGNGRLVQENSIHPELTSSEKRTSHNKTASDEDDETIESIVKYVQSFSC